MIETTRPMSDEELVADIVQQLHVSAAEARFILALERGEVASDVVREDEETHE